MVELPFRNIDKNIIKAVKQFCVGRGLFVDENTLSELFKKNSFWSRNSINLLCIQTFRKQKFAHKPGLTN